MRVLFDLNVVLDVAQKREPHYRASAVALSQAVAHRVIGMVPCHGVTTLHYLITRYVSSDKADEVTDWILSHFQVAVAGSTELIRARSLNTKMQDFEDAVVASSAEAADCDLIVTRNIGDFPSSPVRAVTPLEFIEGLPE